MHSIHFQSVRASVPFASRSVCFTLCLSSLSRHSPSSLSSPSEMHLSPLFLSSATAIWLLSSLSHCAHVGSCVRVSTRIRQQANVPTLCDHLLFRMECRLVLNNLSADDISNSDLSGLLQQQLKYYKFRRVPTKSGKSIFYLFFHREADTYNALRTARSMKNISLVRYRHHNPVAAPICRPDDVPSSESYYRPVPTQRTVDTIRYSIRKYYDQFRSKVAFIDVSVAYAQEEFRSFIKDIFKLLVRRLAEQILHQRLEHARGTTTFVRERDETNSTSF